MNNTRIPSLLLCILCLCGKLFSSDCQLMFEPVACTSDDEVQIKVFNDLDFDKIIFNAQFTDVNGEITIFNNYLISDDAITINIDSPGHLNFNVSLFNDGFKISNCFDEIVILGHSTTSYLTDIENISVPDFLCLGDKLSLSNIVKCQECEINWSLGEYTPKQTNITSNFLTVNAFILNSEITIDTFGIFDLCLDISDEHNTCTVKECKKIEIKNFTSVPSFETPSLLCSNDDAITLINTSDFIELDPSIGSFIWIVKDDSTSTQFKSADLAHDFKPGTYQVSLGYFLNDNPKCRSALFFDTITVKEEFQIIEVCSQFLCVSDTIQIPVNTYCDNYELHSPQNVNLQIVNDSILEILFLENFSSDELIIDVLSNQCFDPNEFCNQRISISVIQPQAKITGPSVICSGETVSFEAIDKNILNFYNWELTTNSNANSGLYTFTDPTRSYLELNSSDFVGTIDIGLSVNSEILPCFSTSHFSLEVVNIDGDDLYCQYEDFNIYVEGTNREIEWYIYNSFGQLVANQNGSNALLIDNTLNPGEYNLEVLVDGRPICNYFNFSVISNEVIINGLENLCKANSSIYSVPCDDNIVYTWILTGNQISNTYEGCNIYIEFPDITGEFNLSVTGTYINSSECTSIYGESQITLYQSSDIQLVGDTIVCQDSYERYSLTSENPFKLDSWEIVPSYCGSIIDEIHTENIEIIWYHVPNLTEATLIGRAIQCDSFVEIEKTINFKSFDLLLTGPDTVCINEEVNFEINTELFTEINWFVDEKKQINSHEYYHTDRFFTKGKYEIFVEVFDANGCLGHYIAKKTIIVNEKEEITLFSNEHIDACNYTDFEDVEIFVDVQKDDNYYIWSKNNQVVKEGYGSDDSYHIVINQQDIIEQISVNVTMIDTSSCVSTTGFIIKCGDDIGVNPRCECINFDYNIQIETPTCSTFTFSGFIDLKFTENPQWYILGPEGIIDSIPINGPEDYGPFTFEIPEPGIYGAGFNYHCLNIGGSDEEFCIANVKKDVIFPYLENVKVDFFCSSDSGKYDALLIDRSRYYTQEIPNVKWIFDNQEFTGDSVTIYGLEANTEYTAFLDITFDHIFMDCEDYEFSFKTPETPEADFQLLNDCEDALIKLKPNLDSSLIDFILWNFNDSSYSRLITPEKVFGDTLTHTIELQITDIHRCQYEIAKDIKLRENILDGIFSIDSSACNDTLFVKFSELSGSLITNYNWSPSYFEGGQDSILILQDGIFNLEIEDEHGCTYKTEDIIAEFSDPIENGIGISSDSCGIRNLYISPSENFKYQWYVNDTYFSSGRKISITNPGNYQIRVEAWDNNLDNQCAVAYDTTFVLEEPDNPQITILKENCDPVSYLVSVNELSPIFWYGESIFPDFYDTLRIYNSQEISANYTSQNGCSSSTDIFLQLDKINLDNISGCYEICLDTLLSSYNIPDPGIEMNSWNWIYSDSLGQEFIWSSGNGNVEGVTIDTNFNGILFLEGWKDDCHYRSDDLDISFIDCSVIENDETPCDSMTIGNNLCYYNEQICLGESTDTSITYYLDFYILIPHSFEICDSVKQIEILNPNLDIIEFTLNTSYDEFDQFKIRALFTVIENDFHIDLPLCNQAGDKFCRKLIIPEVRCESSTDCRINVFNFKEADISDYVMLEFSYILNTLDFYCHEDLYARMKILNPLGDEIFSGEINLTNDLPFEYHIDNFLLSYDDFLNPENNCVDIAIYDECDNLICDSYVCGIFVQNSSRKLHVFPNPSSNKIQIDYLGNNNEPYILQIKDQYGSIWSTEEFHFQGNEKQLDVSNLPDGVYFVEIISKFGSVSSAKFVKID